MLTQAGCAWSATCVYCWDGAALGELCSWFAWLGSCRGRRAIPQPGFCSAHLIFACLAGAEAAWSSTQPTAAAPLSRSWCRQGRSSSRYEMWECGDVGIAPLRGHSSTILISWVPAHLASATWWHLAGRQSKYGF